jgi:hypothetical protein
MTRIGYPSDVSDEEWAFVAPYLQQIQRWITSGVFEAMAHDLRQLLREITDRAPQPRGRL